MTLIACKSLMDKGL